MKNLNLLSQEEMQNLDGGCFCFCRPVYVIYRPVYRPIFVVYRPFFGGFWC